MVRKGVGKHKQEQALRKSPRTISLPPRPRLSSVKIPAIRRQPTRLDILLSRALSAQALATIPPILASSGASQISGGMLRSIEITCVAAVLAGEFL